jgi:O-antigen polysaccharide polymerase Wzy
MDTSSLPLIVLHWVLALTGLFYCYLRARRIDFCSIGLLGSMLYTSAGFTGFVNVPLGVGGSMVVVELLPETQAILSCILATPLFAAVIFDSVSPRARLGTDVPDPAALTTLAWATVVCAFATIATTGLDLFIVSKIEMMKSLPFYSQLWVASATLLLAVAWVHRSRRFVLLAAVNMALILLIGFRSPTVIACIAIFALTFNRTSHLRFFRTRWHQALLILLGIHLVAQFEGIRSDVLTGNFSSLVGRLYAFGNTVDLVTNSEFQGQAGILNTVVHYNYRIQEPYLLDGIIKQVTFTSVADEGKTRSYNDFFQTDLFPDLSWGYASFFFAEGWSNAGWLGVVAYMLIYVLLMLLFSFALRVGSMYWRAGFAVMGTFACFYLHRNSLITLLSIERRSAIVLIVVALAATLLFRARATTPTASIRSN